MRAHERESVLDSFLSLLHSGNIFVPGHDTVILPIPVLWYSDSELQSVESIPGCEKMKLFDLQKLCVESESQLFEVGTQVRITSFSSTPCHRNVKNDFF